MKILVTGATGKVGSEVAKALLRQQVKVIAAGRDLKKMKTIFGDQAEARLFDAYKPETYAGALEGIDNLFLLGTEGNDSVAKWKELIDIAKTKGVRHIIFLSSLGAEFAPDRPQRLVELHLHQSAIPFTILRPNFFFQNFSTDEAESIRKGKFFLPCGKGKTSFVDTRDIAAVAAIEFLNENAESKTVNITGDESLDYFEVAETFSKVLEKEVIYFNPTNEEYTVAMKNRGISDASIKSLLWLYDSVKEGRWAEVSNDFENIAGRKPILFQQFVKDFNEMWL